MIVVQWELLNEVEGKVMGWFPLEDESKREELESNPHIVLVDNIPYPTNGVIPKGKFVEHRISLPEKTLFYVLVDAPESLEEKVERIELETADLWYSKIITDAVVLANEVEISDLWYIILTGGEN